MKNLICASITGKSIPEIEKMMKKAENDGAGIIEIRLDYLSEKCDFKKLRKISSLDLIATNRIPIEGGLFNGSEEERISSLIEASLCDFNFIDLELITPDINKIIDYFEKHGTKLIISSHGLSSTPPTSELNQIFNKERSFGADICKIIPLARKINDNLRCLEFVQEASRIGKVVCFCKGELGKISRLLSPFFGGYFTYASVERGFESAQGQMTVSESKKFYELLGI